MRCHPRLLTFFGCAATLFWTVSAVGQEEPGEFSPPAAETPAAEEVAVPPAGADPDAAPVKIDPAVLDKAPARPARIVDIPAAAPLDVPAQAVAPPVAVPAVNAAPVLPVLPALQPIRAIRIGPAMTPEPADQLAGQAADAETPELAEGLSVISLVNGNTIAGGLRASDGKSIFRWQGSDFTTPLTVIPDAIKSIKLPVPQQRFKQQGTFAFETVGGDLVAGDLSRWSTETVEIDSPVLGDLRLPQSSLRRMYRIEANPTLVFASLSGLHDWTGPDWDADGWNEDGAQLWTEQNDAAIQGDLGVPDRAMIELQLSWKGTPNFVVALGVDPESAADDFSRGWMLATFEDELVAVREGESAADLAKIANVKDNQSIRLIIYLDQSGQRMQVHSAEGERIADLHPGADDHSGAVDDAGPADGNPAGTAIRMVNFHGHVRLETLRVSRWSGAIPSTMAPGQWNLTLADGSQVSGDSIQQTQPGLLAVTRDGESSPIDLDDVVSIKAGKEAGQSFASRASLFLHDGSRVSGTVRAITDTDWQISENEFEGTVNVSRQMARTYVTLKRDPLSAGASQSGRSGRLELGSHRLTGRLVPAIEQEAAGISALRWQPFGCLDSAPLKSHVSGKIIYREPPPPVNRAAQRTANQAMQLQQLRLQQQKRGLNFGELFLQKVDSNPIAAKRSGPDGHKLHVTSGDVITCRIDSISEQGVRISSSVAEDTIVPHAKVKAIELVPNASPPDINEAKKSRLLTLPRLQQASPPTHLLCSRNGDFLRCRLLAMEDEVIRVELQLEEIEIPRKRVAQVIWFHPDRSLAPGGAPEEEPEEEAVASPFGGLAQVIKRDGKRVTFDPHRVDANSISGSSEVLGQCQFPLDEVDQILLGGAIGEAVSVLAYNQWRLRPAVQPLMAQDTDGSGPDVGGEAAMVGQDAPEIKLDLLDGQRFVLSQCKGQIVLLDFWATWCAPCMQTMPLVDEMMAEFDPEEVRLVAVNLEESADHVRAVMERHEMSQEVALDIDGVAAQRYDAKAIPQMVLIDRDGKVARLYVGGGSRNVELLREAITQMLNPGAEPESDPDS